MVNIPWNKSYMMILYHNKLDVPEHAHTNVTDFRLVPSVCILDRCRFVQKAGLCGNCYWKRRRVTITKPMTDATRERQQRHNQALALKDITNLKQSMDFTYRSSVFVIASEFGLNFASSGRVRYTSIPSKVDRTSRRRE